MGQEAIDRWNSAIEWLNTNGYTIRHKFVVWNQGETDGDVNTTKANYTSQLTSIINEFCDNQGADKFLIVRIGNNSNNPELYDTIIETQTEICLNHENAILISTKFDSMAEDGLMKDQWHYTQEGYNITGTDAGKNTAFYVNTGIEPRMHDWEHNNMYSPDGFGSDNTNTPVIPTPTTYTVTYNINGHGTQPSVVTGVTALPNPLPTLTTNDYTFNGWFTNSELTTQAVAGTTITANTTLYAKWTADGDIGDIVSYIYTFDNETENGTTFNINGTVANGMFTVSDTPTTSGVTLATPVTLSPDIDWTVQYIVQEADRGGIALWDSSKSGKGFFSYNGGGMPGFQFRDGERTLTIKANNFYGGIWNPGQVNNYAVTYEASSETFKMYQNGTLLTYVYDDGSAATNWTPVNIDTFAGYSTAENIGANAKIYYVAIHMNKVLTLEELHQE